MGLWSWIVGLSHIDRLIASNEYAIRQMHEAHQMMREARHELVNKTMAVDYHSRLVERQAKGLERKLKSDEA